MRSGCGTGRRSVRRWSSSERRGVRPGRPALTATVRRRRGDQAAGELLAVRLELGAAEGEPSDNRGAGRLDGTGQLVEAAPGVEGERAEDGGLLAAHRRQVGDRGQRPRCLTDDEQPVDPRADEHDVGVLDRRVIRLSKLGEAGDRPALLLEVGPDPLTGAPRVAGQALDEEGRLHGPRFKHLRHREFAAGRPGHRRRVGISSESPLFDDTTPSRTWEKGASSRVRRGAPLRAGIRCGFLDPQPARRPYLDVEEPTVDGALSGGGGMCVRWSRGEPFRPVRRSL